MSAFGDWPVFDEKVPWDEAQAVLIEADLCDGLPMAVPTAKRLEAMLPEPSDAGLSHGLMPPLFGELTNASIAYNCTLAGCTGPHAPQIVATAAKACLEEPFNLLGLATTTGSPAIATVVHGWVADALGMSSGVNCLGPGSVANATLGRAISLVLRNIAGMRTGGADMATMGQPAKYGLCFPEGRDETFQPFHVRRGLGPGESAVTVVGISGSMEVLPSHDTGNWDTPEEILRPASLMMRACLVAGGGSRRPDTGDQVLLLPPELAALIAGRGWRIEDVQDYIYNSDDAVGSGPIAASAEDIHVIVTGGAGVKMTVLPPWGGGTRAVTRSLRAAG